MTPIHHSHRLSLNLSLSDDGALQQVLTDAKGRVKADETPHFLSWSRSKNSQKSELSGSAEWAAHHVSPNHPFAPRIWIALGSGDQAVDVVCAPEVGMFPWEKWLPLTTKCRIIQRDTQGQFIQADQPATKPVQSSQPTLWQQRGYRHVVSLSYDLVDSTALMARLGAEFYSQMLSAFHTTFASIARNWQGQADNPHGDDGCMCYFGAVQTHERAGPAALRAALDMRNTAIHRGWSVRIGMAAGWVSVDAAQPVGMTVHLAARLQKMAIPGAIYVNDVLARDHAHEFDFQQHSEDAKLKGFEASQQVIELVAAGRKTTSSSQLQPKEQDAVFFGRIPLLATLSDAWHKSTQGQGQDLLIMGEPGIGKSSVMRHWKASLSCMAQFVLQCGSHDYRTPFASLSQWIAREIEYKPAGSHAEQFNLLQSCVDKHISWKPYLAALSYLFDLPAPQLPNQFEDPVARHQHVIHAITQWITKRSCTEPVLYIVEDYQWIDASTAAWLNVLRDSLQEGHRIMLVVTQRPPLERQALYVSNHLPFNIEPLTFNECQQLIAALSPQIHADHSLMSLIAARAQGVPLYLKESIRLFNSADYQQKLQSSRLLGTGMPVPDSLQDLLMQRLDQLGSARQLAQLGSVLGQQFSWQTLKLVAAELNISKDVSLDSEAICRTLEQENVWIVEGTLENRSIQFSHALFRDAAYQSMWETDRKQIHTAAAAVLQTASMLDSESSAAQLGRHLAASGEIELAVDHLLKTGKQSKKKGAHKVATQTMETALELLGVLNHTSSTQRRKIEAHLALAGQILITEGYGSSAVSDQYGKALILSESIGDDKAVLRAQLGLESFHFMRGDFITAHRLIEAASTTAKRVDHPLSILQCDWARANLMFYEGKLAESAELMKSCIQWCERHGLGHDLIQNPHVMATQYRAFSLLCLGRSADAQVLAYAGCEMAKRSSNRLTRLQAFGIAAMVEYGCGRWQQALHLSEQAIGSCQPNEYALWLAHAGFMRGAALARLSSLSVGLEIMRTSHALWALHGGNLTRTYYWSLEAEILKDCGDQAGALQTIEQALGLLEVISERYFCSEVNRIAASLKLEKAATASIKYEAYQSLRTALKDAQDRQLHGLALRLAIDLFEYSEVFQQSKADTAYNSTTQLHLCLDAVQDNDRYSDVERAKSCLKRKSSANIIRIDQYKRA